MAEVVGRIKRACLCNRAELATLPTDADRRARARVFYDGTGDNGYSNSKPRALAVGGVGFLKGEQLFHVAKADSLRRRTRGTAHDAHHGRPGAAGAGTGYDLGLPPVSFGVLL